MNLKRLLLLLLSLFLLCSSATAEGRKVSCGEFSITVPYGWKEDSDTSEDSEDYRSLGFFYSPEATGLNVEAYKAFLPEWEKTTMMGADSGLQEFFVENVLEAFSDDNPQYLKTIYTAEGIPLVMIVGTDDMGPFYYAETVLDGWFYCVYAYAYTDDTYSVTRELTAEDQAATEEIFASIRFSVF